MRSAWLSESLVSVSSTRDWVVLGVVVVVCTGLAALVSWYAGLGMTKATVYAAARATLQLAVVGVLIAAVLRSWWLTAAFILVMLGVASFTAGRRILQVAPHEPARGPSATLDSVGWAALPIMSGALPVGLGLVASGLIPLKQVAVVPILGILIGNAMTATSIAGRRAVGSLTERRGEFEAALSIGFLDRDAALLVAREDAALALVPGMDQTRTVGLVTLPGAFVGMLLGGATPIQAAAVQLVVLVGLLLVQAIATALTLELVCRNLLGSAAGVGSPAHLSVQPR